MSAESSIRIPTLSSRVTLGQRLASRENNFDFLRLAAAFAVILSHSYPIRDGNVDCEPYHRLSGFCTLGEVAVAVFFIISGLLVARSFLSDPRPLAYLKKRCLRIFPALVVCVAFCMLVVGPLFTTKSLGDYFRDPDTLKFARNAVLYPNHYYLGGVWEQFADARGDVNGSLWTLPFEFFMYLAILVLGVTGQLKKRSTLLLVAAALLFEWVVVERIGFEKGTCLHKYRVWFESLPQLGFLFFGGTLLLMCKDSVVLDWRIFVACLLVVASGWDTPFNWLLKAIGHPELINPAPSSFWINRGYFLQSLCLPYMVMYLAFLRVPFLQSTAKWGDFSYGVYLYAYPVQQMLYRTWGDRMPFAAFIALACLGTLVLAVLSWHLVEKPFLKLKKRSSKTQPPASEQQAAAPLSSTVQRQLSLVRQLVFFV